MVQNGAGLDRRFTKAHRLRLKRDIDRVFRQGQRRDGSAFSFRILRKDVPTPRLLVVAGRRLGGAVVRNRIRRGVKEAFRKNKELFSYCDVVVIPRAKAAALSPGEVGRLFIEEFKEVWDASRDTADERGLREEEGGAGEA